MKVQVFEKAAAVPKMLGSHTFNVLPRIGEVVALRVEDQEDLYMGRVTDIVHAAEQSELDASVSIKVEPIVD